MHLRRGLALLALLGLLGAKAPAPPPPEPVVKAWAMLFQMMGRLENAAAKHDFAAVHFEDPIANAAVTTLLAQPANSGLTRVGWINFVRDISALHTAADAGAADQCTELIRQTSAQFTQLQKSAADPALLQAAARAAERYTCPMHPDVIGAKGDPCRKCGMQLDQRVVLEPEQSATGPDAPSAVQATIEADGPLQPGVKAFAVLHLRRTNGAPVMLADLIETHTKKIHLLIVDQSLTDYHHEHPRPTATPGDYFFSFTPQKPGPYLAWADLRPLPLGLQEYERATIAGAGPPEPTKDRKTRLSAEVEGFHFQLILEKPAIKVGQPVGAKLRITKADGTPYRELQPVMGAFAHLVGFNEDHETVLHLHPSGAPLENDDARGGPELAFQIYAPKAGFTRLFAQVQIEGRQVFAPFNLTILP